MAEIQLKAVPEATALRASGAPASAREGQDADGAFAMLLLDAQYAPSAPAEPHSPVTVNTDAPGGEASVTPADAALTELLPGIALMLPWMTPAALPGRNSAAAGVAAGVAGSSSGNTATGVFPGMPVAASAEAPGCAGSPCGAASTAVTATLQSGVNRGAAGGNFVANPSASPTANSASATNAEAGKISLAAAAAMPLAQQPAWQLAAGQTRELPSAGHLSGAAPPGDALPATGATVAVNITSGVSAERASMPVHAEIRAPVTSPAFTEEAAQHVNWMVGNGIEHASIRVTPAEMGPIEIRITLKNDEATINFAVTRPETSAAIENALPRLKEMLEASGISLGNTSVGEEAFAPRQEDPGRDQRERAGSAPAARFGSRSGVDDEPALSSTRSNLPAMRLIDLFA